ncbi:CD276 antigen-like [Hoplias malabaricus]|uniref:CD276 antigen-like n=1 Tax=Hoplias malabaricus TaxID=27720 RepID=UPI003461FA20
MCRILKHSRSVLVTLLLSVCWTDCIKVTGMVGTKVILPCDCGNVTHLISWQRNRTIVYNDNKNVTAAEYRNRTGVQRSNCSLCLSQIRVSDEGMYTCYYGTTKLTSMNVTLQVTANFTTACVDRSGTFHCEALEGYPEGKIVWRLNGQPLFPHPICSLIIMNPSNNQYDMRSSVNLSVNGKVTCEVENGGLQQQRAECVTEKENSQLLKTYCSGENYCQYAGNGPNRQTAPEVSQNVSVVSVVCGSLVVFLVILSVWIIKRRNRAQGTRNNQSEKWSLWDRVGCINKA